MNYFRDCELSRYAENRGIPARNKFIAGITTHRYLDYICTMNFNRKITAILFALLALYMSVCIPAGTGREWQEIPVEHEATLLVMKPMQTIFIHESFEVQLTGEGWKTGMRIPGLLFRRTGGIQVPMPLPGFRKIFVYHPETYTYSKSVLLYPFHEFL